MELAEIKTLSNWDTPPNRVLHSPSYPLRRLTWYQPQRIAARSSDPEAKSHGLEMGQMVQLTIELQQVLWRLRSWPKRTACLQLPSAPHLSSLLGMVVRYVRDCFHAPRRHPYRATYCYRIYVLCTIGPVYKSWPPASSEFRSELLHSFWVG
jgi:hypothetical protein